MVAKIKSGKSLRGALNYNENKINAGKAELIAASGFAKDHEVLSLFDKLLRLTDLAGRNQLTKTNTVHISLNFDLTENLEREKLLRITDDYMAGIGFGKQPYLVYQHYDAGHPHVHVLTTNITVDGERISLHHIGRVRSEPARKAIELEYGLVQASSKMQDLKPLKAEQLKALEYGKTDIKRTVTNVVNEVVQNYKFTSLPELNAILHTYHIAADRGSRDSVMFKNNGLLYWALDSKGKKQGVPIKASSLYKKPTLKLLEDRFRMNAYLRSPFKDQLKSKINKVLLESHTQNQFEKELKKLNVQVVFRQNSEGRFYGITFIDHLNKTVFNGSDLGKVYSANAIVLQLNSEGNEKSSVKNESHSTNATHEIIPGKAETNFSNDMNLLEALLHPTEQDSPIPHQLKKKKKRKRLNL
ncbi:MAG: hypothetical protein JWR38_2894 [Mucilaginibacter sp.]|nr:hypothetical protein [Mucilaginibacter sp.]